jgi:membrane protein
MDSPARLPAHLFAWHLLRDTATAFMDNCALRLAAALSYYAVFSLAPLLIIAMGIAGAVFGADAVRGQLDDQLRGYLGAQAAESVQSMIKSAGQKGDGPMAAAIGFGVLLLGASGVFGQLKDALNTIWEVKARAGTGVMGFIHDRVLSFGMVLVIGLLLLMSLVVTTVLAAVSHYLQNLLPVPDAAWALVNLVVSMSVSTVLFAAIFKVLPDVEIPWRTVGVGALVTALLFEVGKFLLAFYLSRESTSSSYGAAGSVILILLWIYYAAAILLFGAEFTRIYARATRTEIPLGRFAAPATQATREQEGMA